MHIFVHSKMKASPPPEKSVDKSDDNPPGNPLGKPLGEPSPKEVKVSISHKLKSMIIIIAITFINQADLNFFYSRCQFDLRLV